MNPFLAILIVLIALGTLILGVRVAQRRYDWHPELSRKSVHVLMGLVCLTFPWLFRAAWAVWTLAGLAVAGLGAVRFVPALKHRFGRVLGGVERESWGELLFPVSVAFLFTLTHGDALLYCVPVLILSLADATAALIGRRYGYARYETDDGWKTIEGSVAFFFIAFLSTHVPLLLASDLGRLDCLLIATLMGLILMFMEAIAWRGLDNLFIPLVSYVCLVRMMVVSTQALISRLLVLTVLIIVLALTRRSTRLTQSAAMGAALVLYVAWAVGDWHWLIAPGMAGVIYGLLCLLPATSPQRHTVHAIACVGGVGLCWLCLSQVIGTVNTIYAYGVGYGANLGIIALACFTDSQRTNSIPLAVLKAVAFGYAAVALPYAWVWRANPNTLSLAVGALLFVGLAVTAFAWWQPSLGECPVDAPRWRRQSLVSAVASALAFCLISLLEPWSRSFQ